MERTWIDIFLDRAVKVIGILGFLGAVTMLVTGFFSVPRAVADNTMSVKELKEYRTKTDLTLQSIQQDQSYTREKVEKIEAKVDRIYELLKG